MQKIWLSIFWKILSCACFAGINVLVRYLTGGSPIHLSQPLPIYTIMFFQNIIGMIILLVFMLRANTKRTKIHLTIRYPWQQILRIVAAAIGIALWYLSLRYIPVTQVVALSFIAPIITTIGAIVFLKEDFNWQRKIAVSLSLIGGFLIARPDQALTNYIQFNWYMLLPLIAAFVFSLDKILTRQLLSYGESPDSLAWYLLALSGPLCLIPGMLYGWVNPNPSHLPWLLLLGALGALAHYSFNKAYALAELTFLMPFGAAKLILCAIISYVAFLETPRTFDMWSGIIVITLSTIILSVPANMFVRRFKAYELS